MGKCRTHMAIESVAATDFWPLIVTLVYGAFGFAHARTKGEAWDGGKFFRLVAIGIGVNVGGVVLGLDPVSAEGAILPFATILVDQLIKIGLSWRTRSIASASKGTGK